MQYPITIGSDESIVVKDFFVYIADFYLSEGAEKGAPYRRDPGLIQARMDQMENMLGINSVDDEVSGSRLYQIGLNVLGDDITEMFQLEVD